MKDRPRGKLTHDRTEIKRANEIAVFASIYLRDENGDVWRMSASSFDFDLKKEAPCK